MVKMNDEQRQVFMEQAIHIIDNGTCMMGSCTKCFITYFNGGVVQLCGSDTMKESAKRFVGPERFGGECVSIW